MEKEQVKPEVLLEKLGDLSELLRVDDSAITEKFKTSLLILKNLLKFDLSILYRVQNVVGNLLLLQVIEIEDPKNLRPDLYKDITIKINLNRPQPEYVNEATAFNLKGISNINVPGEGCDLVGFIHTPEDLSLGYLFSGDYYGDVAAISKPEKNAFEVMCNLLSCVELKTYYKKMATIDSLTGMYNSRYIREELSKVFSRFDRENQRMISIVMCDIDFFKKVNDTYGHIQGDHVLKEVGLLLQSQMRLGFDVIGRFGGEEFLVIMDGNDEPTCHRIVERWCKAVEAYPFQRFGENGQKMPGETFHLTMSFGISTLTAAYSNAAELLADADKSLYHAKNSGRNRVILFSDLKAKV